MKKILFVTHYPGIGGANLSMIHLINNLRAQENVNPFVLLPMHGDIESVLKEKNIPYKVHRYLSWRISNSGKFRNAVRAILMLFINTFMAVYLSYRFRRFDVLYANSSKVVFPFFLKCMIRKPLVWHLREFGTIDYPMVFLLPYCCVRKVYASANALIAISKEIQNYYQSNVCPDGKYKLVYNGIESNDYTFNKKVKNDGTIRICIVGGVDPSKNQEDIIKAIQILKQKEIHVILDVLGQDKTEYGKMLRTYCIENNLCEVVRFKGQVTGINELLPKYDIGVITSKAEAFGRVIVEYMMANLAIIAPNAGACPELIHDKQTGLLYELGNSEQLSGILELLIINKELRNKISKAGNEYAQKNFTAKINAHNIMKVIKAL